MNEDDFNELWKLLAHRQVIQERIELLRNRLVEQYITEQMAFIDEEIALLLGDDDDGV